MDAESRLRDHAAAGALELVMREHGRCEDRLRSVNAQSAVDGSTALMRAAAGGHVEVVRYLLEHAADVQLRDAEKMTALMHAATHDGPDKGVPVTRALLGLGRDGDGDGDGAGESSDTVGGAKQQRQQPRVNIRDEHGRTALFYAAQAGNQQLCRLLIEEASADDSIGTFHGDTVLHAAVKSGDVLLVRYFAEERSLDTTKGNVRGDTALITACSERLEGVARYLIGRVGADVNLPSANTGRTALMQAAVLGEQYTVRWLVTSASADVSLKDRSGLDALAIAAEHGHRTICEWLVKHGGADPVSATSRGDTPIMRAAQKGMLNCVRFFAEECADAVDCAAANARGNTPLHFAFQHKHLDVCKYLIRRDLSLLIIRNNAEKMPGELASPEMLAEFIPPWLNRILQRPVAPPAVVPVAVIGPAGAGKTQLVHSAFSSTAAANGCGKESSRVILPTLGVHVSHDLAIPHDRTPPQNADGGEQEQGKREAADGGESDEKRVLVSVFDYSGAPEFHDGILSNFLSRPEQMVCVIVIPLDRERKEGCVRALRFYLSALQASCTLNPVRKQLGVLVVASHASEAGECTHSYCLALEDALRTWRDQMARQTTARRAAVARCAETAPNMSAGAIKERPSTANARAAPAGLFSTATAVAQTAQATTPQAVIEAAAIQDRAATAAMGDAQQELCTIVQTTVAVVQDARSGGDRGVARFRCDLRLMARQLLGRTTSNGCTRPTNIPAACWPVYRAVKELRVRQRIMSAPEGNAVEEKQDSGDDNAGVMSPVLRMDDALQLLQPLVRSEDPDERGIVSTFLLRELMRPLVATGYVHTFGCGDSSAVQEEGGGSHGTDDEWLVLDYNAFLSDIVGRLHASAVLLQRYLDTPRSQQPPSPSTAITVAGSALYGSGDEGVRQVHLQEQMRVRQDALQRLFDGTVVLERSDLKALLLSCFHRYNSSTIVKMLRVLGLAEVLQDAGAYRQLNTGPPSHADSESAEQRAFFMPALLHHLHQDTTPPPIAAADSGGMTQVLSTRQLQSVAPLRAPAFGSAESASQCVFRYRPPVLFAPGVVHRALLGTLGFMNTLVAAAAKTGTGAAPVANVAGKIPADLPILERWEALSDDMSNVERGGAAAAAGTADVTPGQRDRKGGRDTIPSMRERVQVGHTGLVFQAGPLVVTVRACTSDTLQSPGSEENPANAQRAILEHFSDSAGPGEAIEVAVTRPNRRTVSSAMNVLPGSNNSVEHREPVAALQVFWELHLRVLAPLFVGATVERLLPAAPLREPRAKSKKRRGERKGKADQAAALDDIDCGPTVVNRTARNYPRLAHTLAEAIQATGSAAPNETSILTRLDTLRITEERLLSLAQACDNEQQDMVCRRPVNLEAAIVVALEAEVKRAVRNPSSKPGALASSSAAQQNIPLSDTDLSLLGTGLRLALSAPVTSAATTGRRGAGGERSRCLML